MTRLTPEISAVIGNPHEYEKRIFLEDLLCHEMPPDELISLLYDPESSSRAKPDGIKYAISMFLENPPFPKFARENIRPHSPAPTEISNTLTRVELDPKYIESQIYLSAGHLPDKKMISHLYGPYTDAALKIFALYLTVAQKSHRVLGTRKDGTSTTLHLNKAGAMAAKTYKNSNVDMYVMAMVMAAHDLGEDLGLEFGMLNFERFVNDYVPEECRPYFWRLTNKAKIVLDYTKNYLKKEEGKAFTKENLLMMLGDSLKEGSSRFGVLTTYARRIAEMAATIDINKSSGLNGDYFENFNWVLYRDVYIPEQAYLTDAQMNDPEAVSHRNESLNLKPIDLSINAGDLKHLGEFFEIKNCIKGMAWVNTTHSAKINYRRLNDSTQEIVQNLLVYVDYIVMRHLFKIQSVVEDFAPTMERIRKLHSVLWRDPAKELEGALLGQRRVYAPAAHS